MEEEYKVLCGKCENLYDEDDLVVELDVEDMEKYKEGESLEGYFARCCPHCHTDHYLGDIYPEDSAYTE